MAKARDIAAIRESTGLDGALIEQLIDNGTLDPENYYPDHDI